MNPLFSSLEQQYNLPIGALSAVGNAESGNNPDTPDSPKGAKGQFQFMDDTAKAYGVNPSDPISSATGAAKYLSDLTKQYGSFQAAIAHYNGGTAAGKAVVAGNSPPAKETQNYIQKVNAKMPIDSSQVQWYGDTPTKAPLSPIDPSKVQWAQQPSDTSNFIEGAKASVVNMGLGLKQHVLDPITTAIDSVLPDSVKQNLTDANKYLGLAANPDEAAKNTDAVVAATRQHYSDALNTTAGQVGNVAGTLGTTLVGGLALKVLGAATGATAAESAGSALISPTTYKAAVGTGAALGLAQPTIEGENPAFNTAAGGLLGGVGLGVVNALGRVAQPVTNAMSTIGNKAVQVLKDAGVPLDAAQSTGSALLQRVKAALNDNPITAGAQNVFSQMQQKAYNQAVAKTMGEDSTAITPDVVQSAKSRIGAIYDDVANRIGVHVTPAYRTGLQSIGEDAKNILNPEQYSVIQRNIDNILNKADGNSGMIIGDQYQNINKTLRTLAASADSEKATYGRALQDYLQKGLSDTASILGDTSAVSDLKLANLQWGNMRKIENVADFSTGDVSPSKLYQNLKTKSNRWSFYQDDPQLAQLATAGRLILPSGVNNSGTVSRIMAQAVPAAIGGAAGAAYQGDWGGLAKGAAAGYAAPKLLQMGINNPSAINYLSNGMNSGLLRNLLTLPKNIGAQKLPPAAFDAYLQSLPSEKK